MEPFIWKTELSWLQGVVAQIAIWLTQFDVVALHSVGFDADLRRNRRHMSKGFRRMRFQAITSKAQNGGIVNKSTFERFLFSE